MLKLLKSQGFRVRLRVALAIILIVILGAISEDAWVLALVYCFAVSMAIMETTMMPLALLGPVAPPKNDPEPYTTRIMVTYFILGASVIGVGVLPPKFFVLTVAVTYISDGTAYLVGNLIGGKIIDEKPFPETSPNKTMEGFVAGVLVVVLADAVLLRIWPAENGHEKILIFAMFFLGLLAAIGDLYESGTKRLFRIKDSCDPIVKSPIPLIGGSRLLCSFEKLLGGSEGHGGYLDRIDSLSLTLCYMGIIELALRAAIPQ